MSTSLETASSDSDGRIVLCKTGFEVRETPWCHTYLRVNPEGRGSPEASEVSPAKSERSPAAAPKTERKRLVILVKWEPFVLVKT